MSAGALLLANLAATLFLTGVAWVLQIAQLPLFLAGAAPETLRQHRRRNTLLMVLPMLVELAAAIWMGRIGLLLLVLVIWAVTFLWYIPAYARLVETPSPALVRRLIALNWIRTVCWTVRAAILLWITGAGLRIQSMDA